VGLAGQYNRNLQPQVFFLPANFFDPTADPNTFQSVNASAKNVYQANLNWSLPLLQWENGPTLANAKLGRQNAELGQQQLVIRKVAEARKAYFDALWAQAQAQFWQESQERQGQLLAEARQRFRVGLLGEADTLQAFVQAENVRPQVLKAQNAYLVAEQQLKLLLDLPAEQAVQLTGQLALTLQPAPDEANLPQRPDLQQLQLQTRSLLHQEKLEQARRLPNLQLVGQYSLLTQSEDFQFDQYRWVRPHLIGLQLNVPIFNGFRHSSRAQQVRLQQQQAQQTYQLALKQAQVEVRTLASQLRDVAAQLRAQAGVVQAAERSYRLFRDRWQQGLAKLGELRDNELALQEAKLNHLGLVYQHLLLQNELNRAAGQ
jgi:outer membrane protein TolC